jgi:hypothetical protein
MIHQHHRIVSAIAMTLALGASFAAHAWADASPLAKAETATAVRTQASPAVGPTADEGIGGRPDTSSSSQRPTTASPSVGPTADEGIGGRPDTSSSSQLASQAAAATAVNVKASFTDGIAQQFACFVPEGACGTGNVLPYGKATETFQPGLGCDAVGICDLRTITLPQGTLVLDESGITPLCPGKCNSHGVGGPNGAILSDLVDGTESTGIFHNASGTLTGSIKFAGGSNQVLLSGTIFVP